MSCLRGWGSGEQATRMVAGFVAPADAVGAVASPAFSVECQGWGISASCGEP